MPKHSQFYHTKPLQNNICYGHLKFMIYFAFKYMIKNKRKKENFGHLVFSLQKFNFMYTFKY